MRDGSGVGDANEIDSGEVCVCVCLLAMLLLLLVAVIVVVVELRVASCLDSG